MAFKKIAIIGMSGRFPKAEHAKDLDNIFENKIDCIEKISEKRKTLLGLDDKTEYCEAAYLNDVDYFDYEFFNISKHEAISLDPQQRIALELACEAIENAGYSLKSFKESNTAVIMAGQNSGYYDLFEGGTASALIGSLKDTFAGRISYHLDLHGLAAVIETACSSSLYAIYDSCIKLNAYEIDAALAGGIALDFKTKKKSYLDNDPLGLSAKDCRCKTFDESADGINGGEGGGFVLLKRYEDAKRDKDNILAVITSCGANQDGGRSNNMASPSSKAQAEVLIKTWEKGNINPEDIGYLEAHGTGTKIGDPIEIQGVTEAFNKFTDKKSFCPIGSLKTNYSHLGASAGIISVLKGILSINNNKLYPLRKLEKVNSLIDFEKSAVYPITNIEKWQEGKKKIFATSAFGISGTNVHLVLEEDICEAKDYKKDINNEYIVSVSAKNRDSLIDYKKELNNYLRENRNYSLEDICYTLNLGRDDYNYRSSAKVCNLEEMLNFLDDNDNLYETENKEIILLFSCSDDVDFNIIGEYLKKYKIFKKEYESILGLINENESELKLAFYIAIYKQLKAFGITESKMIGTGFGNIVIDVVSKKISLEEGINQAKSYKETEFNKNGFVNYVNGLVSENNNIVFLEVGKASKLSNAIIDACIKVDTLFAIVDEDKSLLNTISKLYNIGADINWNVFYKNEEGKKLHLPTYPFAKSIVWPKNIKKASENNKEDNKENIKEDKVYEESLEEFLKNIWCEELEVDEIQLDDDFFELGANSLMSIDILDKIEKKTGLKLDFDIFYDYSTISLLKDYIEEALEKTDKKESTLKIKKVEKTDLMDVSYNQRRILYLVDESSNKAVYNMPIVFEISGNLDLEKFKNCIKEIVKRHEILHTVYKKIDGSYYQRILSDYDFDVLYIDECKYENILELIKEERNRGFNLENEIPIRTFIAKKGDNKYLWYINIHHIAADGWSMGVFSNELSKLYSDDTKSLKDIDIQYSDYAYYEKEFLESEESKRQLQFWKEELKGVKGILDFPIDKKRPTLQTFNGKSLNFEIDKEITSNIKGYINKNNISLFMLLESVYALELFRYSGDSDICIGVPVANRKDDDLKNIIGFFANTVIIRNKMDLDESFNSYINKNKKVISSVFSNLDIPFEEVINNVSFKRDAAYNPLNQYSFTLQNFNQDEFQLKDIKIKTIDTDYNSAKFEMTMTLYEEENSIKGILEYNTDLFYEETVVNFIDNYKKLIEGLIENDEAKISNISLDEDIDESIDEEDYTF